MFETMGTLELVLLFVLFLIALIGAITWAQRQSKYSIIGGVVACILLLITLETVFVMLWDWSLFGYLQGLLDQAWAYLGGTA